MSPAYWHNRYWHYWIGLSLAVALVPFSRILHLPLRFDWKTLAVAYWLVLGAQSIFAAVLLCLIGLPIQLSVKPLLDRYRCERSRILLLLFYTAVLGWSLGWWKAALLSIDTIAVIEFRERSTAERFRKKVAGILPPALYLFAGFILVLAYNSLIVSARFNFAYDPFFGAVDKWVLRGRSVFDLSQWAIHNFSLSFFRFLEFIYFGMFLQIGAAIVLTALCGGWNRSMQFVGTILTAYYLALALFCLWPSQGPYYLNPAHFLGSAPSLQAFRIQDLLVRHALALWNRVPIRRISTDYFIGFPCMHIAQPLIVMWFLRGWKRVVIVLAVYDILLIVSILFLEWHCLIDIFGGVLVAGVAIAVTGRGDRAIRSALENTLAHESRIAIE
jgi:hypothetical protein